MNIVIAGAGDVGFHLAELLAHENQDIVLIDTNEALLQDAANHLDVLTIKGDIASIDVLEKAQVGNSQLFIAVTTHQTTNLLASILAKKLGAKKTIARVSNIEYLEGKQRQNFAEMGVDNLISPRLLAAQEIKRLIHRCSFTDNFEFEGGKLSIIGFTADNTSRLIGRAFKDLDADTPDFVVKTIAILRNGITIIPSGDMRVERSDHIYLITNTQDYDKLNTYIGKTLQEIKKIMIIGGSPLALETAILLEKDYSVSVVIEEEENCKIFLEKLNNSLIIHGAGGDVELLKEEGLEKMDAFLALTENSETNIITSLTADILGVYKTIAHVSNSAYTHISQNIGVDTLINKKLIAANNIFRYVRKGHIEAIATLHGVGAEIIEFVIYKNNRVVQVPISDLHLPKDSVIAGVVRGEEGLLPNDDFVLQVGDKIVVFVLPNSIKAVENIFK